MEIKDIKLDDHLIDVLFEFKRNKLCIDGMSLDQVKEFGIHAIRCKDDINDMSPEDIAPNTIYFHQSKDRMGDFAYYLSKAINGEVRVVDNRFYFLATNVRNTNKIGLCGLVECDKLLQLCQAVKAAIREKIQEK